MQSNPEINNGVKYSIAGKEKMNGASRYVGLPRWGRFELIIIIEKAHKVM